MTETALVRSLWRVELRSISFGDRHAHTWHVAAKQNALPTDILAVVKLRFTPQWWESDLHILDGEILYEPAD